MQLLQTPTFAVRKLGLPAEAAEQLCQRVLEYQVGCADPTGRSVLHHRYQRAWVVVRLWDFFLGCAHFPQITTPHKFLRDLGWIRPHHYSELLIDEADWGTVRTPMSKPLCFASIRELLGTRAHTVFISATRKRADRAELPAVFSRFTYRDALRDGIVKVGLYCPAADPTARASKFVI